MANRQAFDALVERVAKNAHAAERGADWGIEAAWDDARPVVREQYRLVARRDLEAAGVPEVLEREQRLRSLLAAARSADACAEPWSKSFATDVNAALGVNTNPEEGSADGGDR